MCSRDDIIEISDSDEDGNVSASPQQTTPTAELKRVNLIKRVVQMTEDELIATHSFATALQAKKKIIQPNLRVPCKTLVKLEDVNVSWMKKENSIEEETVSPIPANPLTISQPYSQIPEDAKEIFNQNIAIPDSVHNDDSSDFDSDATTEFDFCDSRTFVKSEPSSVENFEHISKKKSFKRCASNDDLTFTSGNVMARPHDTKRRCLSPVNTPTAAGPAHNMKFMDRHEHPDQSTAILVPPPSNNNNKIDSYDEVKCDVCGCIITDLVDHYNKEHRSLAYGSGISADLRQLFQSGLIRPAYSAASQKLTQLCAFCVKKMDLTWSEWIAHLLWHTGEKRYECKRCNAKLACRESHENLQAKCKGQIIERRIGRHSIRGYLCKFCNEIKIFKPNIGEHIQKCHKINDSRKRKKYTDIGLIKRRPKLCLPAIKNVSREMYPANPNFASFCVLCNKQQANLAYHYTNSHRNAEVYVSRISPKMKELIRRQWFTTKPMTKPRTKGDGDHILQAVCPFCEDSLQMQKSKWWLHLKSHTGEVSHNTTSKKTLSTFDGYVCNLCNYVQLSEERMKAHVLNQHYDVEIAGLSKSYGKVNLLHSFN